MRRQVWRRLDAACTQTRFEAAWERSFYSAQYDEPPHFYRELLELRGRMRLGDLRGYMFVDTVRQVNADGDTERFAFLRRRFRLVHNTTSL